MDGEVYFWAKTTEDGAPAMSVRTHCLNVGFVGQQIYKNLPISMRHHLPPGCVTLVAAHDIGKMSPGFLLKSAIWKTQWQRELALGMPGLYKGNHAEISHEILWNLIGDRTYNWLLSVRGHHGNYGITSRVRCQPKAQDHPDWILSHRKALLNELVDTFGPFPESGIAKSAILHCFTGMMIFSDWIGSSTEWFPVEEETIFDFKTAERRATRAIQEIGWTQRQVKTGKSFGELFQSKDQEPLLAPRKLQETVMDLSNTPGLILVEAPMGCGKTEAALAGAYRRWTEGEEKGLYFALPTQLTSNRIYDRVGEFLKNVVEDRAGLARIHANAWLMGDRVQPVSTADDPPENDACEANRWFSDSRKSLLAPYGVGTVDQALMAAMPVKFSALRLFALSGKVVVVDEVHSYDPYTSTLVDQAVTWLLECGCTVYVLSATLTAARRAELVAAANGREETIHQEYPLVTKVERDTGITTAVPVENEFQSRKQVEIVCLNRDGEDWMERAAHAAENGACVLVIRNTIATAQQTYRTLKSLCSDRVEHFGLLHSRFPHFAREGAEETWMRRMGKGNDHRPHGAILVGTQVLEQSVDIDADLLFTDLAPTDLILQRIGRLHRHERDRPEGCSNPTCVILLPTVNWSDNAKDIKDSIGGDAYVYPPFSLYLSWVIWRNVGLISIPENLRSLLEATSKIPDRLPEGAREFFEEQNRKVEEMRASARVKHVFGCDPAVMDVEGAQTRWGNTTNGYVVLLARAPEQSGRNVVLNFLNGETHTVSGERFDYDLARKLHMNAAKVPWYLVNELRHSAPPWLSLHMNNAIILCKRPDDIRCDVFPEPDQSVFEFHYHPSTGLQHVKMSTNATGFTHNFDETWF